MEPAEIIRRWLTTTAAEQGITPAAWAKKAGVAPSTVQRAIKPDYEFVTTSRTLAKLASVAGVAPPALSDSPSATLALPGRPDASGLPIRRRVQAGAWLQVDDIGQVEPKRYPASRDPRFPGAQQWLSEVVGDSMNALDRPGPIFEGDLVHVIDVIDSGYQPRPGDVVEAERVRFSGREIEVSLKQVAFNGRSIELWPRSNNPAYREPLVVSGGEDDEDTTVRIAGFVVSQIRRFSSF
jgi:SOS-response transcriptional repressor LexA